MSELLFSRMQSYAWVLYYAKWLLGEEKNCSVSKLEHQMNTRIYNNSFCGLLKNGYPYAEVIQNGTSFLNLVIDGATYQCPTNTAANILRMDFAAPATGVLNPAASEKRELYQKHSVVQEEPNYAVTEARTVESFSEQKADFKGYKEKQYGTEIHEDFTIPAHKEKSLLISVTLDDIIFMPPAPKEVLDITSSMTEEEQLKKPEQAAIGRETPSDGSTGSSDSSMGQLPSKGYGRFRPKNLPDSQETQVQLLKAEQDLPVSKPKRGLFFRGNRRKEDEMVQALKIQDGTSGGEGETLSSCTAKIPPTGGGRLFQHIHIVMLKKQFGSDALGPYRFIFWPVQIPEMKNEKMWADFIVHITEPDGEETVACTDGTYKELMLTLDGKEFNIFSTWDSGIFESHVTLRSKTASIYAINEEIHREEPLGPVDDVYLEQFRHERKGQPKHFVVPFSSCGDEENVPIVGYVEVAQKKYPLVRREGNILRYKYAGTEKVIKGSWKDGMFKYFVEDDSRF